MSRLLLTMCFLGLLFVGRLVSAEECAVKKNVSVQFSGLELVEERQPWVSQHQPRYIEDLTFKLTNSRPLNELLNSLLSKLGCDSAQPEWRNVEVKLHRYFSAKNIEFFVVAGANVLVTLTKGFPSMGGITSALNRHNRRVIIELKGPTEEQSGVSVVLFDQNDGLFNKNLDELRLLSQEVIEGDYQETLEFIEFIYQESFRAMLEQEE